MTAEERMAYFQGEKRRSDIAEGQKEKSRGALLFKLRFFTAVLIFIVFLSFDYTGFKVRGIGSERIVQEVITDLSMEDLQQFYKRFVPVR